MTTITTEVCKEAGVKPRDAERSKNFFALGLVSWLYSRPTESTTTWIETRFAKTPLVMEANLRAYRAGYDFGETAELFESAFFHQAIGVTEDVAKISGGGGGAERHPARDGFGILRRRLRNDDATELKEAADEQRKITAIRLTKWLQG